MATPTLTNLNSAEQFRSSTLDLTDMVVTGSGTITVLIGIDAAAGTLDYLPATIGNVQLFGLGEGQYLLEGSETELTTSLANLGFAPTAGYFGTFSMQIAIGNADSELVVANAMVAGSETARMKFLIGIFMSSATGSKR